MVVASDGIWEYFGVDDVRFLSNEWIITTVDEYYRAGDVNGAC